MCRLPDPQLSGDAGQARSSLRPVLRDEGIEFGAPNEQFASGDAIAGQRLGRWAVDEAPEGPRAEAGVGGQGFETQVGIQQCREDHPLGEDPSNLDRLGSSR